MSTSSCFSWRTSRRRESYLVVASIAILFAMFVQVLSTSSASAAVRGPYVAAKDVRPFVAAQPGVVGPIPISSGNVPFAADGFDSEFPLPSGYQVAEYFISGHANIYQYTRTGISVVAPCPKTVTGSEMGSCSQLPYTTRMLVYYPTSTRRFSGNVWVNPMNPTANYDYQAVWDRASSKGHRTDNFFARRGDVFVGWTSKSVTVNNLKQVNPGRYGSLYWPYNPANPGENSAPYDGITFDVAYQIGALLKANGASSPLHRYHVKDVFDTGFSQDGQFVFTHANIFHNLERMPGGKRIYDGYVTQGALGQGGYKSAFAPTFNLDFGLTPAGRLPADDPRVVMGHRDAPVIKTNTESEIDGFGYSNPVVWRRPDSDNPDNQYRAWEVGAASHDDEDSLVDPGTKTLTGSDYVYHCDHSGSPHVSPTPYPYAYVADAAYTAVEQWVRHGKSPAHVAPLRQQNLSAPTTATMSRDRFGNPLGGVRTPYLTVPIATYHVVDTPTSAGCAASGWADPFSRTELRRLYPSHRDYVRKFVRAAKLAVRTGVWTRHDAHAAISEAKLSNVP